MIREKLKQAQDRHKSYYDARHRPLEFNEGEHVFVRLSPVTGVGRALGVRKLSARFIGPYQIIGRVGSVAYRFALPPNLTNIHNVFHVSQLRRFVSALDSICGVDPCDDTEFESYGHMGTGSSGLRDVVPGLETVT
ncbi:uncharacterized protein LOC133293182 [Gastrolobium bilobum]|uniref:uncharacterized protein LOC133293182 n=1 Tax=Gastrolobium bilobum TaxID=150636 RepID=UPI002AAFC499|nr:uncharacterized protein LOC133293182 [Gastrolobium bilobum]